MSKRHYKVLVTGGPTRAYFDRVRFLSNVSTGQLCYELCRALIRQGFDVAAVVGPCSPDFESLKLGRLVRVETNEEMRHAVMKLCRSFHPDSAIFSAAVLDFVPAQVSKTKVSSTKKSWVVRLKPAPKILDEVGRKFPKIHRIGFKLEWEKRRGQKLEQFARGYMRKKGLHGLVVNFLSEVGSQQHRAHLFSEGKTKVAARKTQIADYIVNELRRAADSRTK